MKVFIGSFNHSSSAASNLSLASRNRARQSKACAATSLSMASTDDSFCSGSPLAPTSISFSSLLLMCLPKLSLTRSRSLLEMKPFPSLSKLCKVERSALVFSFTLQRWN
ncbi:hypothetical protein PsorP6_016263 [Peronosclerospora sorghi]|uniref:Uncharacterized protein n=1 Tax=Peronosclerospora sorghi TaxID=230839 RepID=A0ACC0VJL3_9STRA|nr:hypothetical protein PsorP6_016263 [Peronosclerospora sorghi]